MFHDRDCDLSIIRGKRVAVIGYGSQGRTHALNLRDSGVTDIVVGLKAGSATRAKAGADGFPVLTAGEAAASADVVAVMVSDEAHRDLWRDELAPAMQPGAALVFAHGLSVRFGLVEPRPDLDIILASPKGIGPRIRDLYEEGQGVFCLFGVHQDTSGTAHALGLSYAAALGCGRKGILQTTFAAECESDLFGEQVVLCGGATALIQAGFEVLVEAGYAPEMAYFECLHELKLIVDLIYEGGIANMNYSISNNAEYGEYVTGPKIVTDATKAAMKQALKDIQTGEYAKSFILENKANAPTLLSRRRLTEEHQIEVVGEKLRAMMPWIKANKLVDKSRN